MDGLMKHRHFFRWTKIIAQLVAILCFFGILAILFFGLRFMRTTGITPGLLTSLLFDDGMTLKSSGSRTNILLLGSGGGTHEGGDLTDTMMVVSIDRQKKSVALVSIPRDTWSDTLKDKINSAYHYGEEKKKGGGLLLTKVIVEDMIGMPINYELLIDFSGFKKIVDLIGGVDIYVARAFTDNDYPIAGKEQDTCPGDPTNRCVYETIHFDEGLQRMDGERALKYVRSRHAEGEEGSDFSRSMRQQEIIVAIKNKLVHPLSWISTERITQLPKVLDDATDTDMNFGELATIGKLFIKTPESSVIKISIESQLTVPPAYLYGGRYTLVPTEDWNSIHGYITGLLQESR